MRKLWLIFAQTTTATLAVFFVIGTLRPQLLRWLEPPPPTLVEARPALPAAPSSGLREAARRATPAVVTITASKAPARSGQDPWSRFFRERNGQPQVGLGSAVIVSPEGYLLTNNHVVAGASDIEVQLADGRHARAALVGGDPETDVAVLKIALPGLPAIALGRAADLAVGDSVLAIGNPFNVGQTVTSGIVSALGRSEIGINTFENFIQTDAAINPGNSGGALVDASGALVGINTAIYSRSGGSLGIGFAIPVDTARGVMAALIRDGVVARGWIGVQTRPLSGEFIEAFHLKIKEGVLISGVLAGGPAAQAGVKPGDVVTRVAGKAVRTPTELLAAVAALMPKQRAIIHVQRSDKALEFTLLVAQRPPAALEAETVEEPD